MGRRPPNHCAARGITQSNIVPLDTREGVPPFTLYTPAKYPLCQAYILHYLETTRSCHQEAPGHIDAVRSGKTRFVALFRMWRGGIVGSLETLETYYSINTTDVCSALKPKDGDCHPNSGRFLFYFSEFSARDVFNEILLRPNSKRLHPTREKHARGVVD